MASLFANIQPLHSALDYHLERHNVLASNIAHVDTPNYVPRDLERVPTDSFAASLNTALRATQPGHMGTEGGSTVAAGRVIEDPTAGAGNDKNSVSLDREASKLASNQVRYDVVSAIVSAELADIAFAANDGRGA